MVATSGGMLSKQQVIDYVKQKAPQMGLDPAAVLAVASREGLNTDPGSFWTVPGEAFRSFGPPSWNSNPRAAGGPIVAAHGADAYRWAWTTDGIDYWLRGVQASGAQGLTGMAAISAIVHGFEHPLESLAAGEITSAWAMYSAFAQQVNVSGVIENPSTAGDSGASIVTGPPVSGGTTDTPSQVAVQAPAGSFIGAMQTVVGGTLLPNLSKFGLKPDMSGLILLLGSLFAILIGSIIWNGDKVKRYAPDVAVAAATA